MVTIGLNMVREHRDHTITYVCMDVPSSWLIEEMVDRVLSSGIVDVVSFKEQNKSLGTMVDDTKMVVPMLS